jgi:predicted HD superfamily hydrolase involved in NAD metabolism
VSLPSYDTAHAALRLRLGDQGLAHSEGVADTAAKLAEAYGVDVPTARLAGLLHDWCKETGHAALVTEARRLGVPVTDIDLARPYLLHGPIAAAALAEAFPQLPADLLHAVKVHTFGSLQMNDLDRVVYIADMIEPGRRHHGVDELRSAVGTVPVADLMLLAYARSVSHIVHKRKPLHPTTIAVWNHLVLSRSEPPRPAAKAGD